MKFIHLIILAILCLTIPSVLIYTTFYPTIIETSYSSEENALISGVFSGNFSENKNNTYNSDSENVKLSGFFRGIIEDMNGLRGFAGSIDGNIRYFKLNESNLSGEFSGRLDGSQIYINSKIPSILIILLLLIVFHSLIFRPKGITEKIGRLFIIFSMAMGIDLGINFIFLKILNEVPFSAFANRGFWWQPTAGLIFGALIPWLVFLITLTISYSIDNFNKSNGLIGDFTEQGTFAGYVLALLYFGLVDNQFLSRSYIMYHDWFIFFYPVQLRYDGVVLLSISLLILTFLFYDFTEKIFPKPAIRVDVWHKYDQSISPKLRKLVWIFIFILILIVAIVIEIDFSVETSLLLSVSNYIGVTLIAIIGLYIYYHRDFQVDKYLPDFSKI